MEVLKVQEGYPCHCKPANNEEIKINILILSLNLPGMVPNFSTCLSHRTCVSGEVAFQNRQDTSMLPMEETTSGM